MVNGKKHVAPCKTGFHRWPTVLTPPSCVHSDSSAIFETENAFRLESHLRFCCRGRGYCKRTLFRQLCTRILHIGQSSVEHLPPQEVSRSRYGALFASARRVRRPGR